MRSSSSTILALTLSLSLAGATSGMKVMVSAVRAPFSFRAALRRVAPAADGRWDK